MQRKSESSRPCHVPAADCRTGIRSATVRTLARTTERGVFKPGRELSRRLFTILLVLMIGDAIAAAAIPAYQKKPSSWRTGLAADDGVVWDKDFAEWVKNGKVLAKALVQGNWTPSYRFTFTQCYSGGFVTELDNKKADLACFGANSAVKYFQGASAISGVNSRYAHAWQNRAAAAPANTDEEITDNAYDALVTGALAPAIPLHPRAAFEQAQYRRNGPAERLGDPDPAVKNYAVLFAGRPEPRHEKNIDEIYSVLTTAYGYAAGDIHILYGDGVDPDGADAWAPDASATIANLRKAISERAGFFVEKVWELGGEGHTLNDTKVQLFFWATDHGTVDAPISFSVDPASAGLPGTAVAAKAAPEEWIYEGGGNTNVDGWAPPGFAGEDIDALSFGNDYIPLETHAKPGVYFSVDTDTDGVAGTDIAKRAAPPGGLNPAPDVFVAQDPGNRIMTEAATIGLSRVNPDDLNALSFVPITQVLHPVTKLPRTPVFFSVAGAPDGAIIYVYDPLLELEYEFWDLGAELGLSDIDALALSTPVVRDPDDPDIENRLVPAAAGPTPSTVLFSVVRGDASGLNPASVWKYQAGAALEPVLFTPANLGLLIDDNLNALHTYSSDDPSTKPLCTAYNPNDPAPADSDPFDGPCLWWEVTHSNAYDHLGRFADGLYTVDDIVPIETGWATLKLSQSLAPGPDDYCVTLDVEWAEDDVEVMQTVFLKLYDESGVVIAQAAVYDEYIYSTPWGLGYVRDLPNGWTDEALPLNGCASLQICVSGDVVEVHFDGQLLKTGEVAAQAAEVRIDIGNYAEPNSPTPFGSIMLDHYEYGDPTEPCPGDLDHDGDRDLSDLAQLLANYGTPEGAVYEEGDLDDDGDVDLSDLAALLSVYGEPCP